jgi:glycosyltransferase involved in cell wall biosynthesis
MQLLPALHIGGVERSTLEIAEALVLAGHRSIVVSAGGPLVATLEAQGSTHIELNIGEKKWGVVRHIRALRKLIDAHKPDIVHARSRLPAWIGRRALRSIKTLKRPHWVTTVHGLNKPNCYSAIMTTGEQVICVSETVRQYLLLHYPKIKPSVLRVIPRGIDPNLWPSGYRPTPEWFAQFAQTYPSIAGKPLLTLSGRATRLKNHSDAIRALALLHQRYGIEAALCLLGAHDHNRPQYTREINALARQLGVESHVVMTPARSDVRDVYAASKLVLQLSSKPEAFGRTVIEALSLGVPVVGYAHGGVGELLSNLFPRGAVQVGNIDQLSERLSQLLKSPPTLAPLTRYTLEEMQAQTLSLYESLVQTM